MAKKNADISDETTVTRVRAGAASTSKVKKNDTAKESVESKVKKPRKTPSPKGILTPFIATGRYFAGAWYELKQVRWPTRGATWSLTFAVLVYSAFFIILVLLLDALFKYLFDLMLGK